LSLKGPSITGYGVAEQQPNYDYWVWKSGCSVSGFKKLNLLEKRTKGRWPIYDFGDMTLERGWKCLSGKPRGNGWNSGAIQ
jgi:hypothetical protein